MIYSLTNGAEARFREPLAKVGGVGLPSLAVVFLLIAIFSSNSQGAVGRSPYLPKKNSVSISQATPQTSNKTKPQTTPATAAQPQLSVGGLGGSPSLLPSATSQPLPQSTLPIPTSGGMGGGGGGGTTGSIACDNTLTLAQLCTVCVPPLTLQPGQKALLSSDGTCVAVN